MVIVIPPPGIMFYLIMWSPFIFVAFLLLLLPFAWLITYVAQKPEVPEDQRNEEAFKWLIKHDQSKLAEELQSKLTKENYPS